MTETIIICNMCGKEISKLDLACNSFVLRHPFGYGSVHDTTTLSLDLCSKCQDTLATYLLDNCKVNPIIE